MRQAAGAWGGAPVGSDSPPRLELRLLGGFEATRGGHRLEGFESDKVRALLAFLAIEGRRPVRRERVATLLWPDQPPDVSLHRLRQALANLRAVLADGSAPTPMLAISRADLQLNPACVLWLDVTACEQLIAECDGHYHRSTDRCRACRRRLEQAVDLCSGAFLDGLSLDDSDVFEEWIAVRRQHLERQVTAALGRLAEHAERERDFARAQRYAERRLRFEPWAEEAHRRVIRALAHTQQHGSAIRQYRRCRQALQDELGIEPSAETQALAQQVARGITPPLPPDPPHNLPIQLTRFVGRAEETARLEDLLSEQRLVTLTGAGGSGKTRLALEVACSLRRDFRDGVWLVELARVADPALVSPAAARVFDVAEDAAHPLDENLAAHLRNKEALLVLDNCEHVIGACAALADRLLRTCPDLCILATSREALRITGEHVRHVAPLPVDDLERSDLPPERLVPVAAASAAVQLFLDRATAVRPDLTLSVATARAVARICHDLDGVPLAIELAATWVDTFTVDEIETQLADRFRLLDRGSRAAAPRHQTLEALVDWSYDRLSPAERTTFRRLSVFADGGPLTAAEAVCGEGAETGAVRQVLHGLAAKSLIRIDAAEGALPDGTRVEGTPATPAGERFSMLETLRQYGRRRLDAIGESAESEARHARYFLALAEAHALPWKWAGRVDRDGLAAVDREHDNLHVALARMRAAGEAELTLRLTSALAWYWYTTSHLRFGRAQLEHALATGVGSRPADSTDRRRERANVLLAHGYIARMRGDRAVTEQALAEALRLCREIDEPRGVAGAARGLAFWHRDYAAAAALLDEALDIYRKAGDEERVAWVLHELGWTAALHHDPARARPLQEEALAHFTRLRDLRGSMYAWGVLGVIMLDLDDLAGAQRALAQAVSLLLGVKDRLFTPYVLETCAAFALEAGLAEHALTLLGACAAIRERNGHQPVSDQARRVQDTLSHARARVSPAAAAAAWNRGQLMTIEETLAAALPDQPPFPAP